VDSTDWTVDELTELCLEALATGCVEGMPMEADPEDLASRLGLPNRWHPGYEDLGTPHGRVFEQEYFAGGLNMTRDWKYVTAFYGRDDLSAPWENSALVIRAYLMDEPPQWSAITAELHRYGFDLVPTPDDGPPGQEYTVRASAVSAKVATDGPFEAAAPGRLTVVTIGRNVVPRPAPDRRGHLRNAMRALGKAGAGAWPGWLAERTFTADDYLAVFDALAQLSCDQPARTDEWVALLRWLLDRAREADVFPPAEWVYHWVYHGSPPPAEVAPACLAALPMTLDQAQSVPRNWRATAPEDARRARLTRALLRLAADAAPEPATAAELDRWRRHQRSWIH
jgi:hypothetical protein